VWPQAAIDYAHEIGEETEDENGDSDRWLWVECEGSRGGFHDMEAFTAILSDLELAGRLRVALHGRGPFRRFKDVLGRAPDELSQWFAFAEERQRGRARAWLAHAGYSPSPRAASEVVR
jgi:hypothetical protein